MSDQYTTTTHTPRETHTVTTTGGGTGMAFILGGIVVVLAIIAWLIFGGAMSPSVPAGGGTGDTNVTIQNPAPAGGGETAAPAPEADPATPAPAPAN